MFTNLQLKDWKPEGGCQHWRNQIWGRFGRWCLDVDHSEAWWSSGDHICHLYHLDIGGEKIGHVEEFQISIHDRCAEILNFSRCSRISDFHRTDVEKSEILPNLEEFQISPQCRCEEIWNSPCFWLWNQFFWQFTLFFE